MWFRFFDFGFAKKLFPLFYLMWKGSTLILKVRAFIEAGQYYINGKLEYGEYLPISALRSNNVAQHDCPVCFDQLYKPVGLSCQHVFCEHCIYQWLDKEKTCPVCRAEVQNETIYLGPLKDEMSWSLPIVV